MAIPIIINLLLQSDSLCRRLCELGRIRPVLLFCAAGGEFELLIRCCWVFLLHSTSIGGFVRVLVIDRDAALSILIIDILFLIGQLSDRADRLFDCRSLAVSLQLAAARQPFRGQK